jgi:hypothetical protein
MDNIEKNLGKEEIAKRKEEDERVTKINDESYKDKNIKKVETERDKFKDAKGNIKEKVVEHVTYHNGVVKSRLTSIYKNNRLLYSAASKTKKKKGK